MTEFMLSHATQQIADMVTDTLYQMTDYDPVSLDLRRALQIRDLLNATTKDLSDLREKVDDVIGDAMGQYRVVVDGYGQVERHRKISRRNWQSDDLLRVVLDTRRVDPETGETESTLDKIKHVWSLAGYQARLKALEERGIDPDEFCETEVRPGWKLHTR